MRFSSATNLIGIGRCQEEEVFFVFFKRFTYLRESERERERQRDGVRVHKLGEGHRERETPEADSC